MKLNMVVQRGLNDDEIVDAARWGLGLGCVVRFLEVMPIGPLAHVIDEHLVPASVIFDKLSARFTAGNHASEPRATRSRLCRDIRCASRRHRHHRADDTTILRALSANSRDP